MTIRASDRAPDGPPTGAPGRVVGNDTPATWETASALGGVRGIPWWAAVLLAFAFTGIGVFADLERIGRLGLIFKACYFLGCLLAVLWVQRRGLFGPMVQPPLILALAVPGVVLSTSGGAGGGLTAKALAVGTPLINGFPTMAITTGLTVLVGVLRIVSQRAPRQARVVPRRPPPAAAYDSGEEPLPRSRYQQPPRQATSQATSQAARQAPRQSPRRTPRQNPPRRTR